MGVAHASAVVTETIALAVILAKLHRAIKVCPSWSANARVVDALTTWQTIVRAGRH